MYIGEFDIQALPPGEKGAQYLEVTTLPGGERLVVPVVFARGQQDGPVMLVLGGVHGDEYPGPLAIPRVFSELDPEVLRGTFVGIPVVNTLAWAAGRRENPADGANLARVFPGSPEGSISEMLAHQIHRQFLCKASLVLDLHSAGTNYTLPRLCGYYRLEGEIGRVSREAAIAFGADVTWGTPLNRGRTISEAVRAGVPGIYAEVPGGAACDPADEELYVNGTRNVMRYLGMLDGDYPTTAPTVSPESDYDLDDPVRGHFSGVFVPTVRVLERVSAGQKLGEVRGMVGEVLEEVRADKDGLVFMLRIRPVVHAGDVLAVVT